MVAAKQWALGAVLGLMLGLLPLPALAARCTLMPLSKGKADLSVYFTKFAGEDTTGGRYKKCRLVSKATEGTKTFRVTPFRQDASVVVTRANWP